MMQIYVDAISASRIEDAQYVLQHSLQMERTSKKERVVELLKSGWDIAGEFHNGAGYYRYKIENKTHIAILSDFLKNKFRCPTFNAKIICLSFQEFYNRGCQSEWMNVDIVFWNDQVKYKTLRLDGEEVRDIRDFLIFYLGIKQDKDSLIDLWEANYIDRYH